MNISKNYFMAVLLSIILLVTASCSPKANPNPTSVAENEAPTKHTLGYGSSLMVTFSDGNKCSLEGAASVKAGSLLYEIYVDAQERPTYWLALVTLDEGKTLADLEAIPEDVISQPDFAQLIVATFEGRGSHSTILANVEEGPLYFVCFAGDRYGVGRKIGALGPVAVEQ